MPLFFIVMLNSNSYNQNRTNNSNSVATLSHETGIVLTKESGEDEIKRYFSAILELSKSDNEFPVDFDEVWSLVYTRRDAALRALRDNFIEGVDFQPFHRNVERLENGRFVKGNLLADYHLSLSCLEYFIARKVRPVFEVYRQVFHKAANSAIAVKTSPSYQIEDPIARARQWIEEQKEKQMLEARNEHLETLNGQLTEENNQLAEENLGQKPKVEFADCIMQSADCISVGEMANILKQNKLFNKGQNAFFEWLRYNGYLLCKGIRYNLPTQKSMNAGIMKIAERPSVFDGRIAINRKAVITPCGQRYFIKLFKERRTDKVTLTTLFG